MRIRRKTKRLIALFFCLLMLHTTLPLHVLAQDAPPPSDTTSTDDPGSTDPDPGDPVLDDPVEDPDVDDPAEDPGIGDSADGDAAASSASSASGAPMEPEEASPSSLAGSPPQPAGMSGAASYSIPISVPPGRAGIAPNIALTYSSSRRNGWVGVGWDLDMGSIQRNTKNGVNYGNDDFVAFINGSTAELVNRSEQWGAGCYGSKIEGAFMKFCLNSVSGGWIVTAKDGTKYFYGSSSASRQGINPGAATGTFRWRLNKVEDLEGNYMTVTYDKDSYGEAYLKRIEYTGSVSPLLSPINSVEFIRESREDKILSYISQSKVETVARLKTIKVFGNGLLARSYELSYTYSEYTDRSLLASVDLYGSDGASSLPPVKFSWKEGERIFSADSRPAGRRLAAYGSAESALQTGDVNGDGFSDVVYEELLGPGQGAKIHVLLGTPNGSGAGEYFEEDAIWGKRIRGYRPNQGRGFRLADFNGDGKADFMYEDNSSSPQVHVLLSKTNGPGFEADTAEDSGPPIWGKRMRTYASAQVGFRAADVNGDGLADLVYDTYDSSTGRYFFRVLRSTGSSFAADKEWGERKAAYLAPPDITYALADVNGDGRADVVYDSWWNLTASYRVRVLLSTGTSFGDDTVWKTHTGRYGLGGFLLADVNGDGLSDFIYEGDNLDGQGYHIRVLLSTGVRFVAEEPWGQREAGADYAIFRMSDVNADGLADFVYELLEQPGAPTELHVKLSTGKAFSDDDLTAIVGNESTQFNALTTLRLGDVTGSGVADFAYEWGSTVGGAQGDVRLRKAPEVSDLLIGIENGIGGVYRIDYKPSSGPEYPRAYLPYTVQTVSAITVEDGMLNTDGTKKSSKTTYSYEGGYHSKAQREFRGFRKVVQRAPDGLIVETDYYQGKGTAEDPDCFKGLPARVTYRNGASKTYKVVVNIYDYVTLYPQSAQPQLETYFPRLRQVDEKILEGEATERILRTHFDQYDQYGNVGKKTFLGDINGDTSDGRVEITTYAQMDNWVLSLPEKVTVCSETASPCLHTGENSLSTTIFSYTPGTKRLARKVHWLKGNTANNPVIDYNYNGFGNLVNVIDAEGNPTVYIYDDLSQTFVTSVTQAGLTLFTASYDYRFGALEVKTDANGNLTRYDYDSFGRLSKVTLPYDENAPRGTVSYEYEDDQLGIVGAQKNVTYRTIDGSTGAALSSASFFDGLGRVIRSRSQGPEGKVIEVETEYNKRGQVSRKSLPYTAGETPLWVVNSYDEMGRVTQTSRPDEYASGGSAISKVTYWKDRTIFLNAKGQQRTEYRDAFGRLKKVQEHIEGLSPTTQYDYDPLGNLTMVVDSAAHLTTILYDTLGRKIGMYDPDMGYWSYGYDRNGNLTRQTDARGVVTEFFYDALNRLTTKEYTDPNPNAPETDVVSYFYDSYGGGGTENVKGRLAVVTVTNASRSINLNTRFNYDKRGRVREVIRKVDDVPYLTSTTFDSMDRVKTLTYPNADVVEYLYDAGALWKVKSGATVYAQYSDFTSLGQVGHVVYGNGVATTYDYYPLSGRLRTLITTGPTGEMQNLRYEYDAIGNITWIRDQINCPNSQHMEYDDLNRLTRWVKRCGTNPVEDYVDYRYSKDGNILFNSKVDPVNEYVYDTVEPKHPHAVTGTVLNPNWYAYDLNGNMIKRRGADLTYDSENRLIEFVDGPARASFVYGHDGQRVKKIDSSLATTLYIGDIYERTDSSATRHILSGGQKIAWRDASGVHYYHGDHLGSLDRASKGADGAVEQVERYYPFGQSRGHSGPGNHTYRFTGKELEASGLYYYGARYYDPLIGRFISADSIVQAPGDPQALNRYSYCRNNPLIYTDPSGHFWQLIVGAIIGAVMSGIQSDWDPQAMLVGGLIGGVSAGVFSGAEGAAANVLTNVVENAAVRGAISGAVGGAAAGATAGGLGAAYYGGDIGEGMLTGAGYGAVGGAAFGAIGGHYGSKWTIGRVGVSTVAGGAVAEFTGRDFLEGAAFAFTAATAAYYYQKVVGYGATWEKGGDAVEKGRYDWPVEGANNIGNATLTPGEGGWKSLNEGTLIPRILNHVPGINATGGLHDVNQLCIDIFHGAAARNMWNVAQMIPAAAITYSALMTDMNTAVLLSIDPAKYQGN